MRLRDSVARLYGVKPKIYHMASLVNQDGGMSALCFKRPRSIDLRRSLWTNRAEAVTCKKCVTKLSSGGGEVAAA